MSAAPFPSYTKKWHVSPYAAISPSRPELSLVGKTVVVTGGGSGIGLAIAIALAQAGVSKLAIIGRRLEVLAAAKTQILSHATSNFEILTVSADVANQTQVNEAFARIRREFEQPLDILVSNAGYFSGPKALGTETDDEWARAVNINIKGVYFVSTAFIANAVENATIINVSTAIAHLDPFPGFSSYASTKLAGSKIMQYIRQENPKFHIVDMHPGQVRETDMAAKAVGPMVEGMPDHIDDVELSAHFVVWLASPEARFLRGKLVWCNWDVEELKANAKEIESTSVLTLGLNEFAKYSPN